MRERERGRRDRGERQKGRDRKRTWVGESVFARERKIERERDGAPTSKRERDTGQTRERKRRR